MSNAKQYRSQIEVSMSQTTDADGARVFSAVVRGEKKLFDGTALLEERGGVPSLEARIERAIREEVVAALLDVDEFFKLVRSNSLRQKRSQLVERQRVKSDNLTGLPD